MSPRRLLHHCQEHSQNFAFGLLLRDASKLETDLFVSLFWISNSNCLQIAKPHQLKGTPKLNKMDINSWKGKTFCLWDFLGFDFYAIEFILKNEKKKKKAIMTEIAKAVLCQELSPSMRSVWAARHLCGCHGMTESHARWAEATSSLSVGSVRAASASGTLRCHLSQQWLPWIKSPHP